MQVEIDILALLRHLPIEDQERIAELAQTMLERRQSERYQASNVVLLSDPLRKFPRSPQ